MYNKKQERQEGALMNSNLFYTIYDQIDKVQNSNSDCNYLKLPGISGFSQLGIPVLLNDLKIMDESRR